MSVRRPLRPEVPGTVPTPATEPGKKSSSVFRFAFFWFALPLILIIAWEVLRD